MPSQDEYLQHQMDEAVNSATATRILHEAQEKSAGMMRAIHHARALLEESRDALERVVKHEEAATTCEMQRDFDRAREVLDTLKKALDKPAGPGEDSPMNSTSH